MIKAPHPVPQQEQPQQQQQEQPQQQQQQQRQQSVQPCSGLRSASTSLTAAVAAVCVQHPPLPDPASSFQWSALTTEALEAVEHARAVQQQQWDLLKTERHKTWVFEQKQQQQHLRDGTGASSAELTPQHQQQPPAPQQQQQPSVQQQDALRSSFGEDLQQPQPLLQDPLRSASSEDRQPQQQQEPQQQQQRQQQEPQEQEQGTQQQQQQQPVEQVSISSAQLLHEASLVAEGLQVHHRDFTVGGVIVRAMGADNSTLNIWDIPMQRQLEMATCRQPLPHINVGANAQRQGAWMSFLWDRQTSLIERRFLVA